jgi:transposase-like protein
MKIKKTLKSVGTFIFNSFIKVLENMFTEKCLKCGGFGIRLRRNLTHESYKCELCGSTWVKRL